MDTRLLWRALRARFCDERRELAAIRDALPPDGVAVDVGANRGSYLYWMARWAPQGRVIAFEPQIELAEYLRLVARQAGWDHVIVEHRGVAAATGVMELFVPGGAVTPGASFSKRVPERETCESSRVEVVSLDRYLDGGAVDVIKIDVEGLELDVLRGAEHILETCAPLLVFECEGRHLERGAVTDVLRFLWDRGYEGEFVADGGMLPARSFDPEVHQAEIGVDFFKARDYCNNFVFRRASRP